jgi:acyl-CoA thioester hydrolase
LAEIEVWRGSVAAWECDAMGHLNVGFYVARSMEALAGLAAELGLPRAFAPTAEATLMVREQYIRFLREARTNAALSITGGVLAMEEDGARLLFVMRHVDGSLAATFQTVVAHVTGRDGRAFPWSDRTRARAEALTTTVPAGGEPRSIDLRPATTGASVARADALGLPVTGRGVVLAGHCDPFGRMLTEGVMQRLSGAMPNLFALAGRPGGPGGERRARQGGAAMEYRILHHAWPRAGDRVELRSGIGGGDARIQRIFHWMLDPATGRPWATAQAISVAFDLETRKIITFSEAELAEIRQGWTDGLGF